MSAVIEDVRLIKTDIDANNNKFWHCKRYDNHECHSHWGRVGENGQSQVKKFSDDFAAKSFVAGKIKEKERKGYVIQRTIEAEKGAASPSKTALKDIAMKQIQPQDPITAKLVDYLVKVNVHQIEANTKIKFNSTSGLFQTPLGIVTKDGLIDAREILTEISDFVQAKNWTHLRMVKLVNNYMQIVPQDIGRDRPDLQRLYPNVDAVRKQFDILDSLEASLDALQKAPVIENEEEIPQIFKVKVSAVTDTREIERIREKYKATLHRSHACSHLDLKLVYAVEIAGMAEGFQNHGAKMDNIWELWHGTKAANLLSILKNGFIIPKSGGSISVTGRMFGDGVYFSDQSTKSLNYAYGYWGGGIDNNCFMFLNDVAMGNYHTPRSSTSGKPPAGYDSFYAKAGQSGVANNEMIVFNLGQINPKYLCEFSPGGR